MNYSILHNEAKLAEHFLPYQLAWIGIEDGIHALRKQAVALAEKSVRIGWTYADGFKNVRKRILHPDRDYLFATKDYECRLLAQAL
jgi:phage FluMu gp28-like protein